MSIMSNGQLLVLTDMAFTKEVLVESSSHKVLIDRGALFNVIYKTTFENMEIDDYTTILNHP